jgi:SET domain-containing protein
LGREACRVDAATSNLHAAHPIVDNRASPGRAVSMATRKKRKVASKRARSKDATKAHSAPLFEVRNSRIHGRGVYAARPIRKGARIIEYLGERVSHAEADRRYELKSDDDGHTFLFVASNRTVIDAGVDGNEARFINHSCAPNCESVIEGSRVFIDAIRNIKPGDELGRHVCLLLRQSHERR